MNVVFIKRIIFSYSARKVLKISFSPVCHYLVTIEKNAKFQSCSMLNLQQILYYRRFLQRAFIHLV